ncbi:MAG: DUF3276 family protein [Bacteroidota bacterium]
MINNSVHTEKIRAGKRTYFIDIKKMLSEDYYLTITESRRTREGDEKQFAKTKIFIYPEDINRFIKYLQTSVDKMKSLMPNYDFTQFDKK